MKKYLKYSTLVGFAWLGIWLSINDISIFSWNYWSIVIPLSIFTSITEVYYKNNKE